jgi:hypothetical protein
MEHVSPEAFVASVQRRRRREAIQKRMAALRGKR